MGAQTPVNKSMSLDTKPITTDYQPSLSAAPTSVLIPKTVDYGHGHGMNSKDGTLVNRLTIFKTLFVTLKHLMFQNLEPPLNGFLMARELY